MDVFSGFEDDAGEHGQPGADGSPVAPAALEPVLDGAALWGLELDPRFRVLAATFEPTADRYPWGEVDDRRIQVLMFPVSTILVSLRTFIAGKATLQTFDTEQLPDIVAAFDGAEVSGPLFGGGEPRPGEWGPEFSLQGRSSAPDGTAATVRLSLRVEDLALDVFARFDELRVKDARGDDVKLGS